MARLSRSDQQSSATMSGIFRDRLPAGAERPAQRRALAGSSPHAWFQGPRRKKGASLARFARYVSEIARLHPETDTWDEDPASYSAKSMHFAQTLPGRPPPFFVQSAKRGYMARESCHSSQSNLEDRHNESIGRQNANPKKDPGTTAKSPNAKATLTRPLFLAARSNAQINLSPRRFPQGHQSSQHETISKTAQHQGSLEKSCLRKLIRRSSMST